MKIELLIAKLQSAESKGVKIVRCAIDEEWNAIGDIMIEHDPKTGYAVIFPINTEPDSY